MSHREISLKALDVSEVIMLLMKHPEINTQMILIMKKPKHVIAETNCLVFLTNLSSKSCNIVHILHI